MTQSILHLLILIGAWNCAVLGLASVLEIRRSSSARWVALFCGALALGLGAVTVAHQTSGLVDAIAWSLTQSFFLLGPALYGYRRSLVDRPLRRAGILLHVGCAGVAGVVAASIGGLTPLLILQPLAYVVASLRLAPVSPVQQRLSLARIMTGAILAMAAANAARIAHPAGLHCDLPSIAAAAVSAILLFAAMTSRPFAQVRARYSRSGLGGDELRAIWDRLHAALVDQRLYLQPALRLTDIARVAGVSPRHASQALSEVGGTSFNELLARARVEDAMARLAEPANTGIAIEPLGMEAGFRSRSAFYTAFRRVTGLTPAQFRQNLSAPSGEDKSARGKS